MKARPVVSRVSQATRLAESSLRQASRIASEIWSASLSGWPSVTDSEVNRVDAVMAISPPLNLPRRQGPASGWEGPQAPGSYLWDAGILAQLRRGPGGRVYPGRDFV